MSIDSRLRKMESKNEISWASKYGTAIWIISGII